MDDLYNFSEYKVRELWSVLSERQRRTLTRLAKRALRLDNAARHAYELGRLDEAEMLDEEAARALETVEAVIIEIDSESGDLRVDHEPDELRYLGQLYERYLRGTDPRWLDRLNYDDYVRIARSIIEDAGGNAEHASGPQLLAAGRDAYERLQALGRRKRQQRDVTTSGRAAPRRAQRRAQRRR